MRRLAIAMLTAGLTAGCARPTPAPEQLIREAVEATLDAIPTLTPLSRPSPFPSATLMPLSGLFCEYEFCIGHPKGFGLYDVVAKRNPQSPASSQFWEGMLATSSPTLFIELIWEPASGNADWAAVLDRVIDDAVDARVDSPEPLEVLGTQATLVRLETNATELLPHGMAAAWACGERAFGWKAYADQPEAPRALLVEALAAFRCSR